MTRAPRWCNAAQLRQLGTLKRSVKPQGCTRLHAPRSARGWYQLRQPRDLHLDYFFALDECPLWCFLCFFFPLTAAAWV